MSSILSNIDEDITSTASIIRLPRAVSLRKIGYLKIVYFLLTYSLLAFSGLFILSLTSGYYFPKLDFELNIVMGIPSYVFFPLIILFLVFLGVIAPILVREPNISFTSIYYFSKPMSGIDLSLILLFLLFFIVNVVEIHFYWYHMFIGVLILFLALSNILFPKILFFYSTEEEDEDEDMAEEDDEKKSYNADQTISQDYYWNSTHGEMFQIQDFQIDKKTYQKFQNDNRKFLDENGGFYQSDPQNYLSDKILNGLSEDVKNLSYKISKMTKGKSVFNTMDILLQFVHDPNFKYEYDIDSTGYEEYARYPLETLVDRVGDCECLSILAASIFKLNGFKAALLIVQAEESLHCVAGIAIPENVQMIGDWVEANGVKYFMCEATGSGWSVGQNPGGKKLEQVIPI